MLLPNQGDAVVPWQPMDEATTMASQEELVVGLCIVYPVYYLMEDHHHYYQWNCEKMTMREYWNRSLDEC